MRKVLKSLLSRYKFKIFSAEGTIVEYAPNEKFQFGQMTNGSVIKTQVRRNRTREVEYEDEEEEVIRKKIRKRKNETFVSASPCALFLFSPQCT
jgi:hypothetical protein